jgi:hypothetical protein
VSSHVRVELVGNDERLREPYRGTVTKRATLRLIVSIAERQLNDEVIIDVDAASVEVRGRRGCFAVTAIDQLFVVERQPPAWRFLTWFGVFVRRRGLPDRLLIETPDQRAARLIERAIEEWLGLADEPVRGELRVAE